MNELDHMLFEAEQQERNFADFEDLRFAEIYVDDTTPIRKNRKNQQKEIEYD